MSDMRVWFELREPGRVPELKGPFRSDAVKSFLLDLLEHRPKAFIAVLTLHEGGYLSVEDGPECLEILDRRYRHRARRHRASSKAAFAEAVRK